MASGGGQGGDKERMIYLYHGVSRIFDGYIAGIGLGVLLIIVLVVIILASDDNVAALIHNFGIFFIVIGVLGIPFTYFFMYRGFTYLAMADRDRYGIGALGAIGSLALSLALIPEGALLLVLRTSYSTFLVLSVVTIIVGFVFELLMYIALYRLGDYFSVGYLTAGIIIISLFTTLLSVIPVIEIIGSIIGLIGFVLILVGLNEVKKSVERIIAGH
ncbi:hypothetical protein [Vulcanisaeta sp. JCM 16161]|uniref:hypothetical protein n=1 Tax=Vulcanisaeta sp. JCM 16161 TaxID=1295372 RepID=UPI00406CDE97